MTQEEFNNQMDTRADKMCCPDKMAIKGAIAFAARMCLEHPELARVWYDAKPKVTLD